MVTAPALPHLSFLALVGAALLLWGTASAVANRQRLGHLIAYGGLAEAGIACIGVGYGGASGEVGAVLIFLFQAVARLLAYGALVRLAQPGGSTELGRLRGSGRRLPVTGGLFGFGMFAALGVSPFLVPEGRLLVLRAVQSGGGMGLLLAIASASVVLAWLTLSAVQAVCLEDAGQEGASRSIGWKNDRPGWHVLVLAGFVVLLGLIAHSLNIGLGEMLGFGPHSLPELGDGWHAAALVPYVGAFAVFVLAFVGDAPRNLLAVGLAGASLFLAWSDAALDPLSRLFALVTAGIGLVVTAYSTGYIHSGRAKSAGYFFFLLLMQGALMGLATTRSFGSFYGFWELMTWSSYFLVVHEGTRKALRAGMKYFVMCAGGAYFMLPGLLLLGSGGNGLDFASVAEAAARLDPHLLAAALLLTLTGFAVKAGLVPVHGWLPDAHPVAPSSISGPLSGLLTKTGIYGFARVFLAVCGTAVLLRAGEGAAGLSWLGTILTTLGVLTMVYGEVMALRQDDLKRMLAFSTMGQIGEIVIVFGLGSWLSTTAALSHVVNHAIMKNLLFLGAGALILRAGGRKLEDLAGLGRHMPWTTACMTVGVLSIMGMPPFNGFASKYLMLRACIAAGHPELACGLLLASLAGAVYYMRILRVLIFERRRGPAVSEAHIAMLLPMLLLAALCVVLGIAPQLNLALVVPVANMLTSAGKLAPQALPSLAVTWPPFVVIPMLGAALPFLLRKNRRAAGWSAALVLLCAALAVFVYGGTLDTLSFGFALVVALMGCLNMVYSVGYMEHSHTQWRFYTFFLFMAGGLLGVAASSDLFSFFTFWEIMSSWSLYFVIVHEENRQALKEGYKYFFFNVLGAAFLFLGVLLLVQAAGSPTFSAVRAAWTAMPAGTAGAALALMALGFGMKAAQLPLRIDIQMHPAAAPTPVSGYISSVLLKSAFFGLVKLFFVLGGAGALAAGAVGLWHQAAVMHTLAWVGGVTIVLAALMAVLQSDLKLVLIYSTVSQLGYMVLGVSLGTSLGVAGGLLHLANHVLFKDLLFLVAGALLLQTHKHSLDELGGVGRKMPVTLAVFAVGALSVVGVPPSNGFTSKWIIYHALMQQGDVVLALLSLVGSVLTLAYFAKYLHAAFLGQPARDLEHVHEAPRVMLAPMVLLAAGCVVTGIFPGLLLEPIAAIVSQLGLGTLDVAASGLVSGPGAWNATAVAVLALVAFGIGWGSLRLLVRTARVSDVHTCGVRLDPSATRMASRGIYGLPGDMLRGLAATLIPAAKE
ncbi:NADH/Ubiquinone/plastoquinone (complex I) [Desulfovibrio sp. X2]|uniref:proton-conducting transporter transmembrane domain-containing protein n=1 Tax=Desulfovibrio sp. X2 TaxID=941449 RepID=UPI000358E2EE|nr:proton-conducting transporter membrane subunit [Desulfovibrio sp. X2]EPR37397.1 NADH/Ubiquinone/plastoquinone (complex I) [Desulfovibrio sp. X2]